MEPIKRKTKKLLLKALIKLKERHFKLKGHSLSYLFFPAKLNSERNKLIVVFSGFAGESEPARYNLIRTLFNNKANKLYILDNFGFQKQGSYYLGENGDYFVPEMVESLINQIVKKYNIEKSFFCGSSKGGAASLYYGLKLGASAVISGSPQYLIGNYLDLNSRHREIRKAITGDVIDPDEQIKFLNLIIKNEIIKCKIKTKIHLHYSINEESYDVDVKYLIEELKAYGYDLEEDRAEYYKHGEVAIYFQPYLLSVIERNL